MSHPAIDNLPPIHPGELLRDELEALGLSARRVAEHIGVPPNAVTEIMKGERRITAPMALRLGKAFEPTRATGPTCRASSRPRSRGRRSATRWTPFSRCRIWARRPNFPPRA